MVGWKFSDKFRSQWIKVKFYKQKPDLTNNARPQKIKFCEATRQAVTEPILLDKENVSCPGAQYAFGWRPDYREELLDSCREKRNTEKAIIKSMLSRTPCLKGSFSYIGLNTEGDADLVMSYVPPEEIMDLLRLYHNYLGRDLEVSLSPTMSICAGIAVRTYLTKEICLSFGCADSRKFGDIRRENLAIGIPRELFHLFID
jgi:uncharacterized protein (DUF169 family)